MNDSINNRDDWKYAFWCSAMWVFFTWGVLSVMFMGWIFWGIIHE